MQLPELIAFPGEDKRLEIGDMVLTEHSSVKDLRAAATFLKVSSSASFLTLEGDMLGSLAERIS